MKDDGGVRPSTRAQVMMEANIKRVGGAVRKLGENILGIAQYVWKER